MLARVLLCKLFSSVAGPEHESVHGPLDVVLVRGGAQWRRGR